MCSQVCGVFVCLRARLFVCIVSLLFICVFLSSSKQQIAYMQLFLGYRHLFFLPAGWLDLLASGSGSRPPSWLLDRNRIGLAKTGACANGGPAF